MANTKHSAISLAAHISDLWSRWLLSLGFTGTIQDRELAYLQSKRYDTWSDYLYSLGYRCFNDQKRRFWQDLQSIRRETLPPTIPQRTVHMLAAAAIAAWLIEKYLGMQNRLAG